MSLDHRASAIEPRRRAARPWLTLLATVVGVALAARSASGSSTAPPRRSPCSRVSRRARASRCSTQRASRARRSRAEKQHYRRVRLHGRWIAERTVFLDNRQMDARVGFFVVTPLALASGRGVVLVQRGWAPRNFTARAVLPQVPTPTGAGHASKASSPRRRRGCSSSARCRERADPAKSRCSTPSRARPASICCRCRCCRSTRGDVSADGLLRHWPAPAADVQHALRLCVPVVRHRRGHRLPLCLASIHPPRQALIRRCWSTSACIRCHRRASAALRRTARGRCLMLARAADLRRAGGRVVLRLLRAPAAGGAPTTAS